MKKYQVVLKFLHDAGPSEADWTQTFQHEIEAPNDEQATTLAKDIRTIHVREQQGRWFLSVRCELFDGSQCIWESHWEPGPPLPSPNTRGAIVAPPIDYFSDTLIFR